MSETTSLSEKVLQSNLARAAQTLEKQSCKRINFHRGLPRCLQGKANGIYVTSLCGKFLKPISKLEDLLHRLPWMSYTAGDIIHQSIFMLCGLKEPEALVFSDPDGNRVVLAVVPYIPAIRPSTI